MKIEEKEIMDEFYRINGSPMMWFKSFTPPTYPSLVLS
jgi:hypothetical protein